jgi:hypothetical protein
MRAGIQICDIIFMPDSPQPNRLGASELLVELELVVLYGFTKG